VRIAPSTIDVANYGVDAAGDPTCQQLRTTTCLYRGLGEKACGVPRGPTFHRWQAQVADNADKTHGSDGIPWWQLLTLVIKRMIYAASSYVMMCAVSVNQRAGAYVGQGKAAAADRWAPLAFGLDWHRPSRRMNSTSYFMPTAVAPRKARPRRSVPPRQGPGHYRLIDFNVRADAWAAAVRPQLDINPLEITKAADAAGSPGQVRGRADQERPDQFAWKIRQPRRIPRNMFVWRSNLLGSSARDTNISSVSARTQNAVLGPDLANSRSQAKKWCA